MISRLDLTKPNLWYHFLLIFSNNINNTIPKLRLLIRSLIRDAIAKTLHFARSNNWLLSQLLLLLLTENLFVPFILSILIPSLLYYLLFRIVYLSISLPFSFIKVSFIFQFFILSICLSRTMKLIFFEISLIYHLVIF